MKRIVQLLIVAILAISLAAPNVTFAEDISKHQMAAELNFWIQKNVIQADSNGNYNPNRAVTRGEFASYIARALQLPYSTTYIFKDLKQDDPITKEIQNAAGAGILGGYADGTFKPSLNITRQQMAGMLYKALRYSKVPLDTAPLTFLDNKSISSSFTNAVGTSVYYNIIRGTQTTKGVYFYPKNSATIAHAAAFLYRMHNVAKQYSTANDGEEQPEPETNPSVFYVGSIANGTVKKNPTIYFTYDQADAAYQASTAISLIFQGDKIIKMRSGIAYAADTAANTLSIYKERELKTVVAYTTEGRELKYFGSNDTYAIVQIGDTKGFAKINEVGLTPTNSIVGYDYYYNNGGLLNHKIYNHIKQAYEGEYTISAAPSFMQAGVEYKSYDGVHFYNKNNQLVGTYYPYFQFASIRQPSNYTAQELNTIINALLAERQALGTATYKDATTKSKLIGLGSYLKEIEATYHVNALFILAAAIHESNYGMSTHAQTINNLFGIKVFDSNPEDGENYASPNESILSFVTRYMNTNYVPQSGSYAKGAVPGNKTTGINVHYASDPHWGSKIAGHMWRIDSRFGQKDMNYTRIGMVLNGGDSVNTRQLPGVSSALMYTYKAKLIGESAEFGYPVAIFEETVGSDGYVWYKVYSDNNPPADFVWIRADLVKVLPKN